MPASPATDVPSLADVAALAERALEHLEGDGQALALWESGATRVTVTAVQDGRAAEAATTEADDDAQLARTARAAVLHARRPRAWPAPPLPASQPGRPHQGFDPAVLTVDAGTAAAAAGDDLEVDLDARAVRIAVASSAGVRAAEQRSHVVARVRGVRPEGARTAAVALAGVGPVDVAAAAAEVRALLGEGPAAGPFAPHVPPGAPVAWDGDEAPTVVLGPEAVATVLDLLRPALGVDLALGGGPLAGRRGARVAAPAVNLSDSARHPGTLPRSFDAEGVPRRPVPLIQDGVAHGAVHDSASAARAGAGAASTGHATRPLTLAPLPEHLVLVGGGAEGVEELCAPVAHGLFVPALAHGRPHTTVGAARIDGGRIGAPVAPLAVEIDPLGVLAAVEALSARQRLVALRGHCPGGLGAAVVPALRAHAGLRLRP